MSRVPRSSAARRMRGVSLIETLVALVVLGVGMLGIASLYVASLQAGRTALTRTQAVSLVNDMIDRIRANALARDLYDMDKYGGAPDPKGCVAKVDNCSYQELAEDDLATWLEAAKVALPGLELADVRVDTAVGGKPDKYLVRVEWLEPGSPERLHYQSNLNMIPVKP
jgi:type IV pilus assembly protein PilV